METNRSFCKRKRLECRKIPTFSSKKPQTPNRDISLSFMTWSGCFGASISNCTFSFVLRSRNQHCRTPFLSHSSYPFQSSITAYSSSSQRDGLQRSESYRRGTRGQSTCSHISFLGGIQRTTSVLKIGQSSSREARCKSIEGPEVGCSPGFPLIEKNAYLPWNNQHTGPELPVICPCSTLSICGLGAPILQLRKSLLELNGMSVDSSVQFG